MALQIDSTDKRIIQLLIRHSRNPILETDESSRLGAHNGHHPMGI